MNGASIAAISAPVGGQAHRRLDLHAGQTRRFRALKQLRENLLEALLQLTLRQADIASYELPALGKLRERRLQDVERRSGELLLGGNDRDVRHEPLAVPNGVAIIALVKNLGQPAFRQEGLHKGWQLAGRRLADERRRRICRGLPAPFEAVMRQAAEGLAMPGHDLLKRRLVRSGLADRRACRQVALGVLALAIPYILASQSPESVRRRLW
ncbi:hypothetical protein [Bradyrhizobium sp. 14AA]